MPTPHPPTALSTPTGSADLVGMTSWTAPKWSPRRAVLPQTSNLRPKSVVGQTNGVALRNQMFLVRAKCGGDPSPAITAQGPRLGSP
jgi:hypothetical protein